MFGVRVLENQLNQAKRNLSFILKDEIGNAQAVGAKVILSFESGETMLNETMLREFKKSGGFLSMQAQAPQLHFGLGDRKSIKSVEVRWPDGERTVLSGPIDGGYQWVLTRHSSNSE